MSSGRGSLSKKISALAATDAIAISSRQRNDVYELHDRIDRLTLVVGAMWSLLEEHGYSGDDLIARMQELDAGDGDPDGRVSPGSAPCVQCGAMVAGDQASCQFCGMVNPHTDPLSAV